MKVLLTGGGSAGHVSPLLAIADALKNRDSSLKFLYIGVKQGLEALVLPRTDIPIRFASSSGMPNSKLSFAMLRFALRLGFGLLQATGHLVLFRPSIIVASGGFASAPSVFAASFLKSITLGLWKIPIYIHEQNAVPGRMNLAAAMLAERIGLASAAGKIGFPAEKTDVVGYPVRASMDRLDKASARKELGIKDDEQYVIAFGGSQGARTLNRALVDALPTLASRPNLKIIHASGTMSGGEYESHQDTENRLSKLNTIPMGYERVDYLHDLPVHLAAADLAIVRAGAGSLLEVCATGTPALVIPKANLPGDSQVANGRELAAAAAVELVYEEPAIIDGKVIETVSGTYLAERIASLLDSPEKMSLLSERASACYDPHASARIASVILTIAGSSSRSDSQIPGPITLPIISRYPSAISLRRSIENRLERRFEDALSKAPVSDNDLVKLDDLDYLRYRGAALMSSSSWVLRNEGIKILALTAHSSRLDLILNVITNRAPASSMHRLLGGDFKHVGFERRNALSALGHLGIWNDSTRDALIMALNDPYYEVRSNSLRLLRLVQSRLLEDSSDLTSSPSSSSELALLVAELMDDKYLETRSEAIRTMGAIGDPELLFALTDKIRMRREVLLREALVDGFSLLLDRPKSNSEMGERVRSSVGRLLITSASMTPFFPLKDKLHHLDMKITRGDHKE